MMDEKKMSSKTIDEKTGSDEIDGNEISSSERINKTKHSDDKHVDGNSEMNNDKTKHSDDKHVDGNSEMNNDKTKHSDKHVDGNSEMNNDKKKHSDKHVDGNAEMNNDKTKHSDKHVDGNAEKNNDKTKYDRSNKTSRDERGARRNDYADDRSNKTSRDERGARRNDYADDRSNKTSHDEKRGARRNDYADDRSNKTSQDERGARRNNYADDRSGGKTYVSENNNNNNNKMSSRRNNKTNGVDGKLLTDKTGGAYIPPAKLKLMQDQITDKSSTAYQRIAWEALKKSINGLTNKVNTSNIAIIVKYLFRVNIVRGRGLLCRSLMQAQAASLTFTNVYAALAAVINSKFPNIGELLLKRCMIQFKRAYRRNEKAACLPSVTFIAHLVNQKVAHEIVILEMLTLLIENPTADSIEIAIAIIRECGQRLSELSSKGMNAIFEMLRSILHEGKVEPRVQYMIEVIFQIRKDKFKDFPALPSELDLVDEEDQFTHLLSLDEVTDTEDLLNVYRFDADYLPNEQRYAELKKDILGDDDTDDDEDDNSEEGSASEDGNDEDDDDDDADENGKVDKKQLVVDKTEAELIAFRRTIYLTINSSLDYEECAHKLLRMQFKPGDELELCNMFVDCCAEQRTYEKFYGLLAERFCRINRIYQEPFQKLFAESYTIVHRFDTNKLRNVAKFFAHLLFTDAISWDVLSAVHLNEDETTSSSRIFIKILFQELCEYIGLPKLNDRIKNAELDQALQGLFPKDNPKNTRFSINFFTSIGLGGLTDNLREHLKSSQQQMKKAPSPSLSDIIQMEIGKASPPITVATSAASSSSSSSSSSSDSSDEGDRRKRKRKTVGKEKKEIQSKKSKRH